MRPTALTLSVSLMGAVSNTGCGLADDCDREGCEAIERPARNYGIDQGIAGAAASESDVVANGCQQCSLAEVSLRIWASDTVVVSKDDALVLMNAGAADQTVDSEGTYEASLETGEYLVCSGLQGGGACAGITVPAGEVVTVHVRYVFGPPSLVVFEPGSSEPRTDRQFDIDDTEAP